RLDRTVSRRSQPVLRPAGQHRARLGPVHGCPIRQTSWRGNRAPRGPRAAVGERRNRATVRVALIGPVPPSHGGATPGGVATHQLHLATGLAAIGVDAPLLATNARAPANAWRSLNGTVPVRVYRVDR